ncbi:hypothetical protein EDB92DRAFT_1816518 [Lactarius akahatsu]|uniref:Uncharacterized protein n=1 Tax=Lactarius akahatsu TaxID=416441 RepID=A0AAD4QDF3_9AGAM|nr:hypothetical protein EDB92DRAFT_1816518 [Lactarius akahatsu]
MGFIGLKTLLCTQCVVLGLILHRERSASAGGAERGAEGVRPPRLGNDGDKRVLISDGVIPLSLDVGARDLQHRNRDARAYLIADSAGEDITIGKRTLDVDVGDLQRVQLVENIVDWETVPKIPLISVVKWLKEKARSAISAIA